MRLKFSKGIGESANRRNKYRYWCLRVGPYLLTTLKEFDATELYLIKNDFRTVIFKCKWFPAEEL